MRVAAAAVSQAVAHLQDDGDAMGILLGCMLPAEGGIAVLGCARTLAAPGSAVDWAEEARSIGLMLPGGVQTVGIYTTKDKEAQLSTALTALRTHLTALGSSFTPPTLLAVAVSWDPDVELSCAALEAGKSAPSASVSPHIETNAEALVPTAVLARLTSTLSVAPGDASAALECLQQPHAAFCVLSPKEEQAVDRLVLLSKHGASACAEFVLPQGPAEPAAPAGKGAKAGKVSGKQGGDGGDALRGAEGGSVLGEKALLKLEQVWAHGSTRAEAAAPVLSLVPHAETASRARETAFVVDVLAMAGVVEESLAVAVDALRQRAALQLLEAAALVSRDTNCMPAVSHFLLKPHQVFPITVLMPLPPTSTPPPAQEKMLLPLREAIHRRFMLPMDRPYVRVPQGLSFITCPGVSGRLRNVHEGLPASGVQGGQVHLVQGAYDYCHYMQDKFDDNGWGCMYRSYQTVVSWFRHQCYTSLPIQSHVEIQSMLVKMGDKMPRFVGSKQWIGAMESQMLLDEYLGVSSKIMNVPSGHDLEDKGRELAQHFDSQGTPVCIGGGVLAFTILGVHYNSETCQIRFLILDPHYTGAEDLSVIQNQSKKNACSGIPAVGWHDVSVFRKDSFYNLCLPQRPQTI